MEPQRSSIPTRPSSDRNNVLPRHIDALPMFSMAFGVLNAWCVLSSSFSLSLGSGGPVVILWGLVVAGICNLCLAASLAEFLTAYPTAGGQYHWVAVLSSKSWSRELAWLAGWLTSFGWIAVAASGSLLTGKMFLSILDIGSEDYVPAPLLQFAIYEAITLSTFLINIRFNRQLSHLSRLALVWSIVGIVTVPLVATIYTKNPPNPSFAFTYFINKTGWSDIMAATLGLLQAGLALNGFDAVSHMIEEMPDPTVEGPKIMILCVTLGAATGFVFVAVLLTFSGGIESVDRLIHSPSEFEILLVITKMPILAACLGILILLFGLTSITATSSRIVFALARDRGLPAGQMLCRTEPDSGTPRNALMLSSAVTALLGILFLVSDVAFNAIASASVSALSLSYAFPVVLNCYRGRVGNMNIGTVSIPRALGMVINCIGVFYSLTTSVLFLAPPRRPHGLADINFAPAVFVLMLALCGLTWCLYGCKEYDGPRIDRYDEISNAEESQ